MHVDSAHGQEDRNLRYALLQVPKIFKDACQSLVEGCSMQSTFAGLWDAWLHVVRGWAGSAGRVDASALTSVVAGV